MTGAEFKDKIEALGAQQKDIAEKLGMSKQAFSVALQVKDVKTGFVEKVAQVLGIDTLYFYTNGTSAPAIVNEIHKHSVKGEGNTLVADGGTISADANMVAKLLEELSELRKVNAKLTEALLAGYSK